MGLLDRFTTSKSSKKSGFLDSLKEIYHNSESDDVSDEVVISNSPINSNAHYSTFSNQEGGMDHTTRHYNVIFDRNLSDDGVYGNQWVGETNEQVDDEQEDEELKNAGDTIMYFGNSSRAQDKAVINSHSIQTRDSGPHRPERLPKYNDIDMTPEERSSVGVLIRKIEEEIKNQNSEQDADEILKKKRSHIITRAQDCAIQERFCYKFFNDRSDQPKLDSSAGLRIKFVLTSLVDGKKGEISRFLGHRLFNASGRTPFGMFHSALVVGNWYIEWVDDSIIEPRQISSSKIVFAYDMCIVRGKTEIGLYLNKIAALCCEWNATKTYDKGTCNCQHFTQEILEKININLDEKLSGAAKVYIDKLKKKGSCKMEFDYSRSGKKKKIVFNTHDQLDQFYHFLQEEDPNYLITDQGLADESLLKAFDRAFWIKKNSIENRIKHIKSELSRVIVNENLNTEKKEELENEQKVLEKKLQSCEPHKDHHGNTSCPFNVSGGGDNSVNSLCCLYGYLPAVPDRYRP